MISLVLLLALPPQLDGLRRPIPMPEPAAAIIAEVAPDAWYAAALVVLGAHEGGYHSYAVGDGGRSCGAFQTPCAVTPKDFHGQALLAVKILETAREKCPAHPIWIYASGRCAPSRVARYYERLILAEERQLTGALGL